MSPSPVSTTAASTTAAIDGQCRTARPGAIAVAVAVGIGLIAAQVALVAVAPPLVGVKPQTFAEVAPLIALLAIPSAMGLATAAWLLAAPSLTEMTTRPTPTSMPWWPIAAVLVGGLAMRLVWFGAPAPLEDDFYRYLWDGAVVASGGNPYRVAPDAVSLAATTDEGLRRLLAASGDVLGRINFPDLTTIYPGTAQLAFALAYLAKPFHIDGLRAIFLLADLAAVLALMVLLVRLGRSPLLAALYWMNPLVVFAGIGLAHLDVLLVAPVLAAVLAGMAARPILAGAWLAVAAGVKLWPILLAPLIVSAIARRAPAHALLALATCAALTALLTAPLLLTGLGAKSGLAAYAAGWHINNAPYAWASYGLYLVFGESDLAQRGLRAAVALAAVTVALAVAIRPPRDAADLVLRALIVSAAVFYLSPAQFPWYALWFLALAAAVPSLPLLAASAALPAYYTFFPLWETGRGPAFQYGAAFLHSLPVFIWLAYTGIQRRAATSRPDTDPPPSVRAEAP